MKEKVKELLDQALEENKSLFLIDFSITEGNQIRVIIDGDNGVTVKDCIAVSRAIEHNIDREETDFSLDVASAGVSEPLSIPRQYQKNLGRNLKVRTQNQDIFEGKLTKVDDKEIKLQWKTREPKPIGKGKVTVQK
jgi:ribosome maturation factor RimP